MHLNSGIPNRAFYLAAHRARRPRLEGAGRIWYDVLTSGRLRPNDGFHRFAELTVQMARERHGRDSREERAVAGGWSAVGIEVPRE